MAAGTLRQSKTQEPLRIGIFHSRLILGWYKTLPARFSHGIFWMTNWEINHLNSGPIPVILALLLVLKDTEHPDFEMFYDNYQYYIRIRNNMKYLYNFSLSLWYMIYDMWYVIYDICYMIYDIWYVICDMWYMIYGIWYMIYDIWCICRQYFLNIFLDNIRKYIMKPLHPHYLIFTAEDGDGFTVEHRNNEFAAASCVWVSNMAHLVCWFTVDLPTKMVIFHSYAEFTRGYKMMIGLGE